MRKTFASTEPMHVFAELGAGQLTVTADAVTETVVEVHGPRADDFEVTVSDRQLAVVSPRGRFFGIGDTHHVLITGPTGSDLATKVGSADTETIGDLHLLKLRTGSGDVAIERATGHVLVESGSGDIRGKEFGGDVRIKSGSGDVTLGDVRGNAMVTTGSGDVVIGQAHATTVMKTGSGDLEVKRSGADVSLTTASGDLTLGHVPHGKVVAKNVSGDVRVGIPAGTPVWTDVSSVTGSVASNLSSHGKPSEGQPFVELRASTVSGDVVLQQV